MSDKIIQLNEDLIKHDLKDLVRSSVEETLNALIEYSGQFYTVIPEVGNRRSDVKETVIPEPWKPWFLPL